MSYRGLSPVSSNRRVPAQVVRRTRVGVPHCQLQQHDPARQTHLGVRGAARPRLGGTRAGRAAAAGFRVSQRGGARHPAGHALCGSRQFHGAQGAGLRCTAMHPPARGGGGPQQGASGAARAVARPEGLRLLPAGAGDARLREVDRRRRSAGQQALLPAHRQEHAAHAGLHLAQLGALARHRRRPDAGPASRRRTARLRSQRALRPVQRARRRPRPGQLARHGHRLRLLRRHEPDRLSGRVRRAERNAQASAHRDEEARLPAATGANGGTSRLPHHTRRRARLRDRTAAAAGCGSGDSRSRADLRVA